MFFQILRDTRDVVAQTDEQVQSTGHGSPIRLRLMTINSNNKNNTDIDKRNAHVDSDTNAQIAQ